MSSHKGCDGRQLEPCPFCGGEARLETYGGTCCAVVCQACHSGTPTMRLEDGERAVALVARNPRPFRERWERCQRELAERGQ